MHIAFIEKCPNLLVFVIVRCEEPTPKVCGAAGRLDVGGGGAVGRVEGREEVHGGGEDVACVLKVGGVLPISPTPLPALYASRPGPSVRDVPRHRARKGTSEQPPSPKAAAPAKGPVT